MNVFQSFKAPVAPPRLHGKIMRSIAQTRQRIATTRSVFFSILLVLSGALTAWGFSMATSSMAQSGFGQYLSLIYTDFGMVSASIGSWLSSLLETAPALSLAILLIGFAGVLESVRSLTKNLRLSFPIYHFTF
jgi:hypothetical protein